MEIDEAVTAWLRESNGAVGSVLALRLARRCPALPAELEGLTDPLGRALVGLDEIDDAWLSADASVAIPAAQALLDQAPIDPSDGRSVVTAAQASAIGALENRVVGDTTWWVPAARCHVMVSPQRERAARIALSRQVLPFVLPGELDALQVEVLAAGDRVIPALHIDWMRKLSKLAAGALVADARCLGGWFLPVLRFLDSARLTAAAQSLPRARRLPQGARGLAAAYLGWLGQDASTVMEGAGPRDRVLADLSRQARP